jgi:hypothetical protein
LLLSGATGTPQTHPHLFPVRQKAPLVQRHAEMTNLMNEVWGKPETEQQDLPTLKDNLRVFFAKHKAVRHVTLAPKHWFRYFLSEFCETMLQLYYLNWILAET